MPKVVTSNTKKESLSDNFSSSLMEKKDNHPHHFIQWDRESQLKAFFDWLPIELHDAPTIEWLQFPVGVMGYCVRTVGDSPDAPYIAIAIASALGAVSDYTLLRMVGGLNKLFRTLRSKCNMEQISDLHHQQIWHNFLTKTQRTEAMRKQLKVYNSIVVGHYSRYLQRLDTQGRLLMQAYALPPMPHEVLSKHFPYTITAIAAEKKRKAQSDILVPLYPVLRQLVHFRKQATERMIIAIREARRQVESGKVSLPYAFQHTDAIPIVNREARTIAEVDIQSKEVIMHFVLWDRRTWVLHHLDRFSDDVINNARVERDAYAQEQNHFFVQFVGPAPDLLWFGDLIKHRLLQHFNTTSDQKRRMYARNLGFSNGCQCSRTGLLGASEQWFSDIHKDEDFLFEPEALYRGVLYGTTLAMIALSNGSRTSELLQISWNKERRVTRVETVPVLGEDGHLLRNEDGGQLTKQIKIHLQYLLPKGGKTEEERQLFPLSKESMRLLGEIKQLLEKTHSEIPVVFPSRASAKYEYLKPEQYVFQWAASSDGVQGIINVNDVQVLLRFILHGLDLYTAQGEPIRVSIHLLRHVMATHARHYRQVPPEAIAHFFLHHQLKELTGQTPLRSDISEYYTQMTEEQRITVIRAELDELEEMDRTLVYNAPSLQDLEQMNEDLRIAYEKWQTLHPTTFGNCGCPGLCPRDYDRTLCIGCSYLVTDPEKMGVAIAWRTSYMKKAELLEVQGNYIDARQARLIVQQLDDMINIMRLQQQAESDGFYIPLFRRLPQPEETKKHEEI